MVACFSKKFVKAQDNYSITDKEVLKKKVSFWSLLKRETIYIENKIKS